MVNVTDQAVGSHELRRRPHVRLGTCVPDVARRQALLEEVILIGIAGVLVEGSKVPEQTHVPGGIVRQKLPDDAANDRQVEAVGIRMTFGTRRTGPEKHTDELFGGAHRCAP